MDRGRRTFLKEAGIAVTASALGAAATRAAESPRPAGRSSEMPKGLTLATIRRGGVLGLAVRTPPGLLDVREAEARLKLGAPTTIGEVLAGGGGPALARLVERAAKEGPFVAEDRAEFGPCVTHPGKIVCVGLNYRKHAAETGSPVPDTPVLFNKYTTALTGHGSVVRVSGEDAVQFDYEVELVIVMGRLARNVAEADALDHVFGYCTGNDFSARDLQRRSSQWMLGKTLDRSSPIGPWLVSADLVGDPDALKLECRVNGEVRQSSTTADMIFGCRRLVAYISRYLTLEPGDVIFTGTPEGVIGGYPKDRQVWLRPGDRVTSTVEKLGEQTFTLA
jgi:2-keto-4-pentenoate hydratase/2-oxohepta-3-ene-1,7-dioic acid hydratase in catechol pathway